jgi:hypothetical protein
VLWAYSRCRAAGRWHRSCNGNLPKASQCAIEERIVMKVRKLLFAFMLGLPLVATGCIFGDDDDDDSVVIDADACTKKCDDTHSACTVDCGDNACIAKCDTDRDDCETDCD